MAYNKDEDKLVYETADVKYAEDSNKVVKANLNGVNEDIQNTALSNFSPSENVTNKDKISEGAANDYKNLISKENIISNDVMNSINSQFVMPSAVTEADAYLSSQLSKIQSGRTSYSDDVKNMMDKILNRDKFSYDVDTDPLFQQALASAMNSGKQAMQDTIGQASALTGGYGSTYATTAGNQAYNSFIEDAYDNLPQYYQMAMEAYQMEGDELYRQFGMYSELDDKEYNRYLSAYDATSQYRNQLYNEAYGQFRDSKSDAFATANLQLNEYGQRVNDAYNYYNIASNEADKLYEREYNSWRDQVSQATQWAQLLNSDYWSQTNFDEGVRQYEKNFAEDQRQYNETLAENKRQYDTSFAENQRQFNESYAQTEKWNQKELDYKYYAANKSGSGGSGGSGSIKSPTSTQISSAKNAFKNGGISAFSDFLDSLPDDVNTNELIQHVSSDSNLGLYFNTYTKTKDTINWFGGVDGNDKVKDQNGKEYKVKDLPKDVQQMITDGKKDDTYYWNPETKKWEKG